MVNVASAHPFNLHNWDVSVDASASPHPRSDSPEDKQVYHHSQIFFDVYPNRNSTRNRKRCPYPPTGADLGQTVLSDEIGCNDTGGSPINKQPSFWSIPIINARRAIDLADSDTRGRTVDHAPSDLPCTADTVQASTSIQAPDSDSTLQKPVGSILKFAHDLLKGAFCRLRLQASSLSSISLLLLAGKVHNGV